ncbi:MULTISPECIES: IS110 family RNA-guided transposase [Streptomycetaceae]|uniref:Transposase IS116/IS110/IS902 family protein n=1 Tax=Streptantibioticus cattleyicolor (strain ATCC 35852 / DSM 46488 / JCM 4925 / NBRC 14057 / NRRL 8057) TaxID=1003195 RepID=G8WW83_STREN|nr:MULTISPECIES: IS110 family transposase [Streptomycetaceae]AEW93739.1 transposase IS116/IS110/IS902 family protein [Streptantibioticus cattleyicolor NRRL 8057 = DSM 46488]AEW99413.1 transposase IS116/IS110/IS902 family protein [Streptantibioticus cattleyicolor NRRL 8057 = DSM 46488]MYS58430.1 IS110 family transposase [Streptomyces sp. SID5468]CCB74087.1 transposase [Streptantibioticus cattleyicolor NRRL 8057 = DSM 46488]
MDVVHERCAGIDIGKADVKVCVRVPGPGKRRRKEVRTFSTMTRDLLAMRDWLIAEGITVVGMEATGSYWKPVFYLLENDIGTWLLNARHMKNVPGRTDVADSEWICKMVEHGLVRPSFVPPPEIRQLRDLTRYRTEVIRERTREAQRLEKLLEDAGIKLSAVVSDLLGKSSRAMLEALIAGERDPLVLAEMAKASMRAKRAVLAQALTGRFTDHHAFLARTMLDRIGAVTATEARLSEEITRQLAPFRRQVELLTTIPGVNAKSAEVILAEIGVDMSRFPTAAHLASWAGMCPGNHESAGKHTSGKSRPGDPWLKGALGLAATAAARTKGTYLAARYKRIAVRRGKKRALVAIGHTILTPIWHMLTNDAEYAELGGDYFVQRTGRARQTRRLVSQLNMLGYQVSLQSAEAV